ncbi:amino acid--tRNA ligase-related protein [Candidatus Carsonella ruddii]|uniref:amino acid--tRNA ligase-related protein n=1 Tax=Carsonella ruddii TaxID=114186 RepID=UPI003D53B6DF
MIILFKKTFFLLFCFLKKIKKIGHFFFINLYFNNKKINLFFKNKIKIKPSLIGIYGLYYNNTYYIYEICYYKNKSNKIDYKYCKIKSNIINFIRFYFYKLNFFELDTPVIDNYTNSGSKQFLIINKKKKNNFFSLSQSPQCIKQYYMFNNIKKYFKLIKCFRDEDERSNRLKEFYQIDIEISNLNFLFFKKIINILIKMITFYFFKKKIFFLTIKYKYIKKFFFEKKNFKKPYIYKKIKIFNFYLYIFKSIKNFFFIKRFFFYLNINKYIIIISKKNIDFNLCYYFDFFLKYLNIINNKIIFLWYVNFLYYKNKKNKHHHFSSYKNRFSSVFLSKSLSYDLNINGVEIGGGSVRNINFNIQKKNFFTLKEKKSFFLNFYKKNIPHHCGIAIGLERFLSNLLNINIKNTITYKKYIKKINSININDFF